MVQVRSQGFVGEHGENLSYFIFQLNNNFWGVHQKQFSIGTNSHY